MSKDQLSEDIVDWIEEVLNGKLLSAERHVARREAWMVEVQTDNGTAEAFFRIDRKPVAGSTVSLEREAMICAALQNSGVPAPAVLGWDAERQYALFERVDGSAAIDKLEDTQQQRQVMNDFIDAVACLHQLQPADLDLTETLGSFDLSPAQCALNDVNAQLAQFADFLKTYRDPLICYGVQWLQRFAPTSVSRVALVQGDTGPVNFMFDGSRVTALVDWEWGHWGDPMEDLGNICVREFWNPSGGLKGLFKRYQQSSGIPYSPDAARYYRVQQNVRGMIPIHAVSQSGGHNESMAWYLAYKIIGDRATCEAIAEAMGIAIERPALPAEGKLSPMAASALNSLQRDLEPHLNESFARSRAADLRILIECMDRRERFTEWFKQEEIREMGALLDQPISYYEEGVGATCEAIEEERLDDEALVQYLARRAYRDEWLHQPVTALYPNRAWSEID